MKKLIIQTIKNDLQLSIYKIVLIANFLALALITGYLTHWFIPPVFSGYTFLKLDFIDVIVLMAFPFLGIFYTYVLICLIPWLLLLVLGSGDLIAYTALLIASISFYSWFLILIFFLFSLYHLFMQKKLITINKKRIFMLLIWSSSAILSAILSAGWMTFLNWAFILDWYQASEFKSQIWTIFLPFNLVKFLLQAVIFICILIPLLVIIKKYTEQNYYILL